MNGLKTKRLVWTILFLGITLAAILMEVVAGIFHPAGTIPWTEYLAQYVPWPIQLAAYVVLAVWLPFHFWRADAKRKKAFSAGVHEGLAAAKANHAQALEEAHATGYNQGSQDAHEYRTASGDRFRCPHCGEMLPGARE